MKEQGIEELFKSAFNNFEADVDPNVWSNVQQAIHPVGYSSNGVNAPAAAPSGYGANGSVAGKVGTVAGKLGVKAIIVIVTAATGVTVGAYFMLSNSQSSKVVPSAVQAQPQVSPLTSPPQGSTASDKTTKAFANSEAVQQEHIALAEKKVSEENKPVTSATNVNSAAPRPLPAPSTLPAKSSAVSTTPAASAPSIAKTESAKSTPPSSEAAKADNPKPSESETAPENHTYQNDMDDISNYLEPEASSGTAALPNAFSPNGDGKNDFFTLRTKNLKTLEVTVFDQSGRQVYHWNGLDGAWDGNLADGSPAPVGNYFYTVNAETTDGKICVKSSPLMLRRY